MKANELRTALKEYIIGGLKKTNIVVGITIGVLIGASLVYAITKPYTFSSGTTISSSEVNENFDELYTLVNSGVYAKLSTSQSVPLSTIEKIKFDTQLYGDSNFSTSNYRYTVTEPGLYQVDTYIDETSGATTCHDELYINGSPQELSPFTDLVSGDYIEVYLDCSTETTFNAAIQTDSYFMVKRIW